MEYNESNFILSARSQIVNYYVYFCMFLVIYTVQQVTLKYYLNKKVLKFAVATYKITGFKFISGNVFAGYLELVICTLISFTNSDL